LGKASKDKRRRDRLRRDRHRRNQPRKPPSGGRLRFGRAVLAKVGPVLQAKLEVPITLADELRRRGEAVPEPVAGALLIDTGATKTCISQAAAARLGLLPTRIAQGYGAGGKHENPVYLVRFALAFLDEAVGLGQAFEWEQEAQAIPDLEKASESAGLMVNKKRIDFIGLLGRDVLQYTTFHYQGPTGEISIEFDTASMQIEPLK